MQNKSNEWKTHCKANIYCLLFLIFFHLPSLSAKPLKWNTRSLNDISIFFTESDTQNADAIQSYLTETLPELTRILTFDSLVQTEIYLCPTPEIFEQFTGGRIPEWSEAICISNLNQIILKSPNWSQSRRAFRATILHELTHLILAQRVNYHPIPTWLNEGLAVYFSGERSLTSIAMISEAQATHSLIPLSDIQSVLSFQRNKALLAYQQSFYTVQFLFQEFGSQPLSRLLDAMRNNVEFEKAFRQTYQMDFTDFEQQWREHIRTKNRWDFMFDFSTFLWILMGLLFVVAVILSFFRKRQRLRAWEQEEQT